MKNLLKSLLSEPDLTPAGVVAGLIVSAVAARFARAAWDAARQESERQKVSGGH